MMGEYNLQNRYPGGKPFESNQSNVFFGRGEDIARLHSRMEIDKCIVLFSKSGSGKTSLINAGIIPYFYSAFGSHCDVFRVRFNGSDKNNSPAQTFVNQTYVKDTILDKVPVVNISIWQAMKSKQFDDNFDDNKQYLIIFDQFEELFNYDETEVEDFKFQLSNLYNNKVPSVFQKTTKREVLINKELEEEFTQTNLEDKLQIPIPIRILISIRSDKLSLLNKFKDCFPELMLNCYELTPLDVNQACEAIIKPAQLDGEYISPKFEYSSKALTTMLDFLSVQNKRWVEPFQLQIICQYIEEEIVLQKDEVCIESHHVDGKLKEIIREYYEKEVKHIGQEDKYIFVKRYIEEKFILIKEKRRVSIDQGTIEEELGFELSQRLFTSKLFRSEPNNQEGISFELSHDSVIDPILISKTKRESEESKEKIKIEQYKKYKKILLLSSAVIILVILIAVINNQIVKYNSITYTIIQMERELYQAKSDLESQKKLTEKFVLLLNSVPEHSPLTEKFDSLSLAVNQSLRENTMKYQKQKNLLEKFKMESEDMKIITSTISSEREELMKKISNLESENKQLEAQYKERNENFRKQAKEVSKNLYELGKKIDSTHYLNSRIYPNDAYVRRISLWFSRVNEPFKKLEVQIEKEK